MQALLHAHAELLAANNSLVLGTQVLTFWEAWAASSSLHGQPAKLGIAVWSLNIYPDDGRTSGLSVITPQKLNLLYLPGPRQVSGGTTPRG